MKQSAPIRNGTLVFSADNPPNRIGTWGYDPARDAEGFEFDVDRAARAVEFFPAYLTHVKGPKKRQPIELEAWQAEFVGTLFGWIDPVTYLRRYRESLMMLARKNTKSTMAAGLLLLLLGCDGEGGAECYGAAKTRDQAGLIYQMSEGMVLQNPELQQFFRPMKGSKTIWSKTDRSAFYRAIASDAGAAHGFNAHAVIVDEVHTLPNSDLWSALETSQGSRSQPLMLGISTAGYDRESLLWREYQRAKRVIEGESKDPRYLPVIFEAEEDDDWTSEETWRKANPNLGVSVELDYIRRACEKAKESAAVENEFRQLHLNQWTEQLVRWLPVDKWRECGVDKAPDLRGRRCFGGLDLSTEIDLTAFVLLFPLDDGTFWIEPTFWLPGASARRRSREDHVPYQEWIRDEHVLHFPGAEVLNYEAIRRTINDLGEVYEIETIGYDGYQAAMLRQKLEDDGFSLVKVRQSTSDMNSPCKMLYNWIVSGKVRHANNPCMDWCVRNVATATDNYERERPAKEKSSERIDGVVASLMAIGVADVSDGLTGYVEGSLLL